MYYVHTLFLGVWRANGIMRASYPEDDEGTLKLNAKKNTYWNFEIIVETLLSRVEESRARWILCEPETSKMCLSVGSKANWEVEVVVIGEVAGCISIDVLFKDDGSGIHRIILIE